MLPISPMLSRTDAIGPSRTVGNVGPTPRKPTFSPVFGFSAPSVAVSVSVSLPRSTTRETSSPR
jgi:hypothetical protein